MSHPVRPTRRRFLAGSLAAGAGLALGGWRGLIDTALAADPGSCARLSDIDHVVILIQENRSFDHYFGTLAGVRGYGDASVPRRTVTAGGQTYPQLPVFYQQGIEPVGGYAAGFSGPEPPGFLLPFHFDTNSATLDGECLNDIVHDWGPQHRSWDNGVMDQFLSAHLAANGSTIGPETLGYYTRADLPFYYALADAFTICDGYHCSVMGPTDPNRLYTMSATLDPDGRNGGPLVETLVTNRAASFGKFTWKTMPEALQDAGVSWKVYQTPDAQADDVLLYFKAYTDPTSPLSQNAFLPTFPGTFNADVLAGTLPQVSWVLLPVAESEHPGAPPAYGEYGVDQLLAALVANPAVWEKTVMFVTYDENGGFFDHVPPVTPPPGTAGEYLTVDPLPAAASGTPGPIGLGFRVPMLVVSPFSRGGLVCSDVFDHTSLLRFIETRFGVTVPNLTTWRRSVTGDLTASLNLAAVPDASLPSLPTTSLTDPNVVRQCATNATLGTGDHGQTYPLPPNSLPVQESGTKRRPSGSGNTCTIATTGAVPGAAGTSAAEPGAPGSGPSQATPIADTGVPIASEVALGAVAVAAGGLLVTGSGLAGPPADSLEPTSEH